ncbi:lanthionine synthetase C family protein [Actinocrispum wychmicini]|uniref:Lanthionine synthetase-like protein n=1 Tax=Actinocrispum wychmicini TaxID=1213861 RepID=A0A4R2IUB2_9PSEU|nr:lanthionine synthetase C family protein [Actinocrispum wychmicini]TCO46435.1 lanthionine synthetase-like protein [Actinocrispum wychmicini]
MSYPNPSLADLAEDIAAGLTDPTSVLDTHTSAHTPRPQSLAGGSAGVALLHTERAFTQPDQWSTAHTWLSAVASGDLEGSPGASLFFGVPALAFVTRAAAEGTGHYQCALAQLDTASQDLTRVRLAAAHARIDRGERPALAEFDLIRGLTGLGAYHLLHSPEHEVTAAVLTYLVRLTEPLPGGDGLPGWWTDHGPTGQPPADYLGGHGNFGMAHGIAGPLALLALAMQRDVIVNGHHQAIARICTWLDAWQHDHPAGPWWPRTITLDETRAGHCDQPEPLQPSWCYGTPGIARAQQLAAIVTGDTARQRTAETTLLGCLTDPGQLARIVDPSLCHGAAGLLHTAWRAAADAATDELSACLPHLAALLVERLRTAPRSIGLLEGSTGAALALHAAATGTVPQSSWDTCLLLA